jgi:hypothetical protein
VTAPLTSPECEPTGFTFMLLNVARLRDSELATTRRRKPAGLLATRGERGRAGTQKRDR